MDHRKKLIDEIGKPFLFRIHYTFNGGPYDYGWRGKKQIAGGGAIIDMGYHMLDLLIWYFGMPNQVFSQTSNCARPDVKYETEDSAILTIRKGKSLMGQLVLTRASQPKEEQMTIHGTKGTLKIDRQDIHISDLQGRTKVHVSADRDWGSSIKKQIDSFVFKVKNGQFEDSSLHLNHLKLIEAAYKSEKQGKCIQPLFPMVRYLNKIKEVQ